MIDITGAAGTIFLGVQRHAKVCDAVTMNGWKIRGQQSRRFHDLHNIIMAIEAPTSENESDIILWRHGEDDYRAAFPASKTWEQLRSKWRKVDWNKVVWFAQGVPQFSFILWLAITKQALYGR